MIPGTATPPLRIFCMNAEPVDIWLHAAQTGVSAGPAVGAKTFIVWLSWAGAPEAGAVPQRCERDVAVDVRRTAEELRVVVRHQGALGVAEDVDLRAPVALRTLFTNARS